MEFFIDTDDQNVRTYLVQFIERQMDKYSGISLGDKPKDGQILIWCKKDISEIRNLSKKYMFRRVYAFTDKWGCIGDNVHYYNIGKKTLGDCAWMFKYDIDSFLEDNLPTSSTILSLFGY